MFLERVFKLGEHKTSVRTEVLAGITTFVTMAYIIFVNPIILSSAGMDAGAVMVATCISAAIGTLLTALLANYPFAQAPGMGLNAFFAYTICGTMGYSWQAGLAAVFISGAIFILITATSLRTAIVKAIPNYLKKAISAGIGLFIAYIGIKNAGFLKFTVEGGHIKSGLGFVFKEFTQGVGPVSPDMTGSIASITTNSGIIPAFDFTSPAAVLALVGLIITAILVFRKVRGSLLIGIVLTSVIGSIAQFGFGVEGLGITLPQSAKVASIAPTFGKFLSGFGELFTVGQGIGVAIFSILTVLISLTMVDMFDTIGTLIGTASKAKLLDESGNLPGAEKALLADAIATSVGAVFGTSTVTTYVESSAGISEGGRTGLTSVVTAILFVLAIFLSPLLGLIPGAATAPALIIVGVLMIEGVKDIEWGNIEVAIPAFLTMACMPFAYSIADGISTGFIFYVIAEVVMGKAKKVNPIMYILAALFVLRYILIMTM